MIAFSIASGLNHLHTEIFGSKGKPAIAHRLVQLRILQYFSCEFFIAMQIHVWLKQFKIYDIQVKITVGATWLIPFALNVTIGV